MDRKPETLELFRALDVREVEERTQHVPIGSNSSYRVTGPED